MGRKTALLGILAAAIFIGVQLQSKDGSVAPEAAAADETATPSESGKALAQHFGYALQAASICEGLQLRMDTEKVVDSKIGSAVRGKDSQYGDAYQAGLFAAIDDGDSACATAWEKYGCNGSVEPALIQQNGTAMNNPQLCRYE